MAEQTNILEAAGLEAPAGAPLAGAAFIAKRARVSGRMYKRGWWVKSVARPTLAEKNAEYRRFSGDDMFALYPKLKTEHAGEGSFEAGLVETQERMAQRIRQGVPGFSLRDLQLGEGAWTLMRSTRPGKRIALVDQSGRAHANRIGC